MAFYRYRTYSTTAFILSRATAFLKTGFLHVEAAILNVRTHAQSDEERADLNFEREEQLAAFCRARLDRVTQRTLRYLQAMCRIQDPDPKFSLSDQFLGNFFSESTNRFGVIRILHSDPDQSFPGRV